MFGLSGKELKYAKELLCRACVGRVKTVATILTNHLHKTFQSRMHKASGRNTAARINSDKSTETNS